MSRAPALLLSLFVLCACASTDAVLPPPPVHADGQTLWKIIDGRCVPDQIEHGEPKPCAEVVLGEGRALGHVVLKDRDGVGHRRN